MHDAPPVQPTLSGLPEPLTAAAGQGPDWPTTRWLAEGLRAAFFLPLRIGTRAPAPWQLLLVAALVFALEIALLRLEVAGPAQFDLQAWLSGWWGTALGAALAWWVLSRPVPSPGNDLPARPGLAAFLVLWFGASLPNLLLAQLLMGVIVHGIVESDVFSQTWFYWALYGAFTAWSLAVTFWLITRFAGFTLRAAAFMVAMLGATALTTWYFEARTWQADETRAAAPERPRLRLSQETLEAQQALWQRSVDALAPERPGVADVYGLVFAPYAAEDVFLRESTMVSGVLAERFDAQGRVLHLLNHAGTALTHPWATPLNLQRAVEALAARMDREKDVLVVYLTSHGARDFRLAASHWPLDVPPLSPAELREALDKAGIRHRVIAVSACYSGGWVDVLAGDGTLVMTAADATHTSYGCGQLSELTFFGRALFDEQLRKTHSFERAFARAVPIIAQREIDAGKDDGFSNPQIRVGAEIGPVLRELEQRLGALHAPIPSDAAAPAPKTRP